MSQSDSSQYIEADKLRDLISTGAPITIIDVRSAAEYLASHVEGSVHIPADELAAAIHGLPKDRITVTVCNHGGSRSSGAADLLRTIGFPDTVALKGGVHGWYEK